jgi:hypothetical protein
MLIRVYKYHSLNSVPSRCLRSEMLKRRGKQHPQFVFIRLNTRQLRRSMFVNYSYTEQRPLKVETQLAIRIFTKKIYDNICTCKHEHQDTKSKKNAQTETPETGIPLLSTCFGLLSIPFTTNKPTKRNRYFLVLHN